MKQKNFISCVVYMHNVEKEICAFMTSLHQIMKENFDNYEIICVDDSSGDSTCETLQNYIDTADKIDSVSVIKMSYYQGQEAAMNAGRDLAVGDFVFEFDSITIDYDDNLILEVYEKSLEGFDIVAAVPKNNIALSSKLFYYVYNFANKTANKLQQERFRVVSRRAINRVNQLNLYVPYRKAMYVNCGLLIEAIYYKSKRKAVKGRSAQEKMSRSDLAFDSFIIFTDVLEKISLGLCVFFLLIMIMMALYVVWSIFSEVRPVEGWMSIFGLLSFGFFGLFLLLTLILKYLSVILNLVFKKQRYVIAGIEKLTKKEEV